MFIEPSEHFTPTAKTVRRPPTERNVRCERAECQRCMSQLDGRADVTATWCIAMYLEKRRGQT